VRKNSPMITTGRITVHVIAGRAGCAEIPVRRVSVAEQEGSGSRVALLPR
jgi:hypothetical protein